MPPSQSEPSRQEHRRYERRKTLLAAKIETVEGTDDCVVHDLSAGGAEISSVATLTVDRKVALLLPRVGKVPGRVAWCDSRRVGIQFLENLEPAALSGLMKSAFGPAAASPEPSIPAARPPAGSDTLPASPEPVGATPEPDPERAALETRLLEAARRLDLQALEVAIEQIALLARLRD